MLNRASVVVMGALLLAVLPSGAASAQYGPTPPAEPEGTVSVLGAGVTPGGDLAITGEGFDPGTEVVGVLIGPTGEPVVDVQATTTVAADGTFRLVIPIPSDAPCGVYTVTVTGTAADGSPRTISQEVTVGGCSAGGEGGTRDGILAVTGLQLGAALATGLGLLGLGTVAVRVSRRRATG